MTGPGPNPDGTGRELLALGAATLGESGGMALPPRIRPVWPGAGLAAPAFTVWCPPGDNLAVHVAVASAGAGQALVVAVAGTPDRGYWGEVLTTGAEARGLAGMVIDACVRDVVALERHRFPVFSSGVALRGASKEAGGRVGCAIRIGDAEIRTGDWVVGDADGVAVVAQAELDEVMERARARAAREAELFDRLRNGGNTVELLGLDRSRVGTEGS